MQTQFLNLVVNGQILLNICVCGRNVGLRLVVIVVGDKIFHCIFREKLLELAVELGRERLVVAQYQGWAVQLIEHVGDGKGLA